ncbi:MAG: hypothetical protein IE916_10850, partial [Epsilonproteobacteria bacterium]|nr:hypothetical protein [Campylobacterota bacterium]
MRDVYLLFSHSLSDVQKDELQKIWHVRESIHMPQELQKIWSNISPDLESLDELLAPVKSYLVSHAKKDDLVLIQGDFGAVYIMVNFAKSLGLTVVYATTKRIVQEYEEDGKMVKKSIFEHRRFREYGN